MGALPKQRVSRHRQGNRRRHHFIAPLNLVACRHCGELKLPHHVCPTCGMYNGRQVIEIEERKRQAE
jgi:large subunit ribosomal protein L32